MSPRVPKHWPSAPRVTTTHTNPGSGTGHSDAVAGLVRSTPRAAPRQSARQCDGRRPRPDPVGRLMPGARLPLSRTLAAGLGVARNTAAQAYSQLVAEGWLTSAHGSRTTVSLRAIAVVRSGTAGATTPSPRCPDHDLRPGHPRSIVLPPARVEPGRQALALDATKEVGGVLLTPSHQLSLGVPLHSERGAVVIDSA